MKLSTILPVTTAVIASLLAPTLVEAQATTKNCFILVHGYQASADLSDKAQALGYWNANGDFGRSITGGSHGGDHYAIVGWNSRDLPYWHPDAAGSVAEQIAQIQSGVADSEGRVDGVTHERQCTSVDRFYVVAHSQGAQVMTYINGNAQPSDPNFNYVSTLDQTYLWKNLTDAAPTAFNKELPLREPSAEGFDSVMSKVTALITVGGAVNGTEGMDLVCNNQISAALAAAVGRSCVPSLQTADRFSPASWTGPAMYRPTYALGGHGTTLLSGTLTGEDDGVVNLASQMNCRGSAKRSLWEDLREWNFGLRFTCDSANKRHRNHYNLASIEIAHNAEVTAPGGYFWSHAMNGAGVLQCGDGRDVPSTIAACISQIR